MAKKIKASRCFYAELGKSPTPGCMCVMCVETRRIAAAPTKPTEKQHITRPSAIIRSLMQRQSLLY
jgi:hypothetical protein